MKTKDVIKVHMDRLKSLDRDKEFNQIKFNLGLLILIISFGLGWIYSWGIFILGMIIYSYLAYSSVKW